MVTARYRQGLLGAIKQKRDADTVIEAISMEDIGVLPGKSVAESLNVLTGVAGALDDDGKIDSLAIRGAQDLSLSTLNGRELVTTVIGSRSVDYSVYPASLIASAQVHKSAKASLIEGGLSGLINMNTLKPSDFSKDQLILSGQLSQNRTADNLPFGDDEGLRFDGTWIKPFSDTQGIILALAFTHEPILKRGSFSPYNWGDNPNSDLDGDMDNGNEFAPWGGQTRHEAFTEEHVSYFFAHDWKSDSFTSSFDILSSELETEGDAQHTQWGGHVFQPAANWSNLRFAGDDLYAASVKLANGNSIMANIQDINRTEEIFALGWNLAFRGDDWQLAFDLSSSEATFHGRWASANLRMDGAMGITYHYNAYGSKPSFNVTGASLLDPTLWTATAWRSLAIAEQESVDELTSFQVDFSKELDTGFLNGVSFGARAYERDKHLDQISRPDDYKSGNPFHPNHDSAIDTSLDDSAVKGTYTGQGSPVYLAWDLDVIAARHGGYQRVDDLTAQNGLLTSSWEVNEETTAAYVQLDFSAADDRLRGNMGVRWVDTDSSSPGHVLVPGVKQQVTEMVDMDAGTTTRVTMDVEDTDVPAVRRTEGVSYSEILPSFNLVWAMADTLDLRFAFAKVLARPNIDDLRSSTTVARNVVTNELNGSGGNPQLEPTLTTVAWEWYPREGTTFAFSAHYSELDTYVAEEQIRTTIGGLPAQIGSVDNGSGGNLRGWEISFLHEFPGGFGVSGNYAFTESTVEPSQDDPFGLVGFSEDVWFASGWWATEKWEVRVGANYRSDYTDLDVFGNFLTVRDFTRWSANIGYNATEQLRINLFGDNLTNEEFSIHTDDVSQRTSTIAHYGAVYGMSLFFKM